MRKLKSQEPSCTNKTTIQLILTYCSNNALREEDNHQSFFSVFFKLHCEECLFKKRPSEGVESGGGLLKESSVCLLAMRSDWDWGSPANTAV